MTTSKTQRFIKRTALATLILSTAGFLTSVAQAAPLKIGYSDWPGFVAWQIAIDKGWLKEAGVDASFQWFDYSASLDAFAAGKLDAVGATNGDMLVTGAGGTKGVMVLLTDYSSGNDMVIGTPAIKSIKDLAGKSVGVERGLVDHLLLVNALKKNGIAESSVKLVNGKTNELPQVLASGSVAAVAVWQPVANQTLKAVAGSHPLYTSADAPGLIYDGITVNPASLAAKRADWIKMGKVWDRVVKYINDPKTQPDAVRIMSGRVGVAPATYQHFLNGTHLLDLTANQKAMVKGKGFDSIYGSTYFVNQFNVTTGAYKQLLNADSFIDPNVVHGK